METEQTFEQIAREFGPMINRIVCSYEANASLAEELVQEIHIALWRALPRFRAEASMRTFVARVATNRALSHVARQMRFPPTVELDADLPTKDPNPEIQAIEVSDHSRLVFAIRNLPLEYRQAATLTLEGLTAKEIAAALGITTNAVTIRLSRARNLLRKSIGENA